MSRRSARNRPRQRAAKAAIPVGGTSVSFSPAQLSAMLAAQQQLQSGNMTAQPLPQSPYWETAPFGPGRRLPPAPINTVRPDTGRAEPRLWEFPVSWNLQIDDRWHVPWRTLQHAADMPLFRKCIERRKSVCGLDFTVTVDPKAVARAAALSGSATKDVESELRTQYMSEISRITDWLQEPDPKNGLDWQAWTSLLMENQLKFGASVVYPRKTFGGDLFALEVIDSKTIKPLLDEYGGRPAPPQPAYQQIMYGFPRGEFLADADIGMDGKPFVPGGYASDELVYERRMLRSESPYGLSATEIALLDGLVWMRRMGWILSEYTEGVTPGGLVETDPTTGWDVTQWEDFSRSFNAMLEGDTAARQKWPFMPPGTKMIQPQTIPEQYKPDYDLFLIKLVAGDFGLPASEVGFTETGALGASFHEGEEDILNRQTRIPDADWLSKIATKLCKRQLGMPSVLQVQILGLESEDEAAADAVAAVQVSGARLTVNEDRARRGLPTYTFPEADMPMLTTPRGVVFLEGASKTAQAGEVIGPPKPIAQGPGADEQEQDGQGDGTDGQDEEDEEPPVGKSAPVSKSAERAALRRWLARHPDASRPFVCKALTADDALDLADDPRVVLVKVGPNGFIHGWIFVGIPVAGDHVSHPHHGHGIVTEAHGGHVGVKFDSGQHHEFPVREDRGPGRFEQMTDEELANELAAGQGQRFHQVVAELDRRDRAEHASRVRSLYAEKPQTAADRDRVYQGLVNEGENPEDAWSHAHGVDTEQMQRQAVIAQLRDQGYKGGGFDALSRDAFKHDVQRRVLDAETATNGYMLSRDGEKAGVDPWSLFTGPEARARKYASSELREWWDKNGRPTAADFQSTLMGHAAAGGPRGGDFYA